MKVLVVGIPRDFSADPYDGFTTRHRRLTEWLATRHDLAVATVRMTRDSDVVDPDLEAEVLGEVAMPSPPMMRGQRLRLIVRYLTRRRPQFWELDILALAESFSPDVLVTLGPWVDGGYHALRRAYPSVHFFEEDVWRMPSLTTQSRQARFFRAAEAFALRTLPGQPSCVVVIADPEKARARRRYRGASITTIPYTLPAQDWPTTCTPSVGDDVAVLGVLNQTRNSDGLVALLEEMVRRGIDHIPFRLLSDAGIHPRLTPFVSLPWVRQDTVGVFAWPHYRTARLALVPAAQVTGMKTTVLQAWSQGVAVLAYDASARGFPERDRAALCCAATPEALCDALVRLWDDGVEREALAIRGLTAHAQHYSEAASLLAIETLVESSADGSRPVHG